MKKFLWVLAQIGWGLLAFALLAIASAAVLYGAFGTVSALDGAHKAATTWEQVVAVGQFFLCVALVWGGASFINWAVLDNTAQEYTRHG